MAIKNNLKVQGIDDRNTTFCYRGLYDQGLEDSNKYIDNDVVKKDNSFVKYNSEATPKWQPFDIDNEILNTKYESGDSLYFNLLNDSINTSLAISTPLMNFLNEYSSAIGEINENTDSNSVKNFLNNSLNNLIPYNVLDHRAMLLSNGNRVLADFYTYYTNQKTIYFVSQYNTIDKNRMFPDTEEMQLYIPDNSLKFDIDSDNKIRIKHFNQYGSKTSETTSNIDNWGQSTYFNSYLSDNYGHIKDIYYKKFTIPKKPSFNVYYQYVNLTNNQGGEMSTSTVSTFFVIASLMNDYLGKSGAILEIIFLPGYGDTYDHWAREVKISLDSSQFVYNEKKYITPYLSYKLTSETSSSGYGGGSSYYKLEIWFERFNYLVSGYKETFSPHSVSYANLYEVRLKCLVK